MSPILPHPILSIFLVIFWLVLQQSHSLGQVLLGAVIALAAGWATRALRLERPTMGKPWLIVPLVAVVVRDVFRSNFAVAWIVLTQGTMPKSAGFLRVPLQLRNRTALAFLAMILTATPGTVWLEFDEDAGELLLHVLDLVDEAAWIETIKNRYERLLLEIFA